MKPPSESIPLAKLIFIRLKRCRYIPIVFSIYSAFPLILRRSLSYMAPGPGAAKRVLVAVLPPLWRCKLRGVW
jgi:hypothetical protein